MKKITVKNSSIHNTGVYAAEPIKKGEIIIEYQGEVISSKEGDRRSIGGNDYILLLDDKHDIDGTVNGNEAQYVNHSCEPNCDIETKDGKAYIVALTDIKKGEEFSYDYEFDDDEDLTKCSCKKLKCRGYINTDPEKHPDYENESRT